MKREDCSQPYQVPVDRVSHGRLCRPTKTHEQRYIDLRSHRGGPSLRCLNKQSWQTCSFINTYSSLVLNPHSFPYPHQLLTLPKMVPLRTCNALASNNTNCAATTEKNFMEPVRVAPLVEKMLIVFQTIDYHLRGLTLDFFHEEHDLGQAYKRLKRWSNDYWVPNGDWDRYLEIYKKLRCLTLRKLNSIARVLCSSK